MNLDTAAATQLLGELDEVVLARWAPEVFRRFQCVWLTHVLNLSAQEIAKTLGLNVSTVRRIRTEFLRDGARAIDGKGNRGGRRNQCMSLEDELAFLREHAELFSRSGVADLGALKLAFEARIGRTIHKTTLYRLLERHGRKRPSPEPSRDAPLAGARRKRAPGPRRKPGRVR
jgi:transposase